MIVEKKIFTLPAYETISGRIIKDVRIGWESYGTLNADKSNAILICHYFSGSSHAAGRYAANDPLPGYWDAIIGPGKAIDTNRYFVFSSDTLCNLNAFDPTVTTTGPASIDPETGEPYGLRFPVVSIGDFVRVQKKLVDSLGIQKLHAVCGPSMGGLQTLEWAATYPEMMDRIMPVIATPTPDVWLIAWLNIWRSPIEIDALWNNGDYYKSAPPMVGLKAALKIILTQATQAGWAEKLFGRTWADPTRDPLDDVHNQFKLELGIDASAIRAPMIDANHLIYLTKANQTFMPGAGAGIRKLEDGLDCIKASTLMLYAPTDAVFQESSVLRGAQALKDRGVDVALHPINGPNGHLNGLTHIGRHADIISNFLE